LIPAAFICRALAPAASVAEGNTELAKLEMRSMILVLIQKPSHGFFVAGFSANPVCRESIHQSYELAYGIRVRHSGKKMWGKKIRKEDSATDMYMSILVDYDSSK
jgi:hypothetical protein